MLHKIDLKDVDGNDLIILNEEHCLREQVTSYFDNVTEKTLDRFSPNNIYTAIDMVAAGLGKTMLPEMAYKNQLLMPNIACCRFKEPAPKRTVALTYLKDSPKINDIKTLKKLIYSMHN